MQKLYSYVIVNDAGAAPNPYWGVCTLTICKPQIRRTANVDDWILGFGSTNAKVQKGRYVNYSGKLVYAMNVTDKLSLEEYDAFCKNGKTGKIASFREKDWRRRVGDCIYSFNNGEILQRKGVHNWAHIPRDLSGKNSLLSTNFYYFGSNAIEIPAEFNSLIHRGRSHKICSDLEVIKKFEQWIGGFKNKRLYGDPQQKALFCREEAEDASCSS